MTESLTNIIKIFLFVFFLKILIIKKTFLIVFLSLKLLQEKYFRKQICYSLGQVRILKLKTMHKPIFVTCTNFLTKLPTKLFSQMRQF